MCKSYTGRSFDSTLNEFVWYQLLERLDCLLSTMELVPCMALFLLLQLSIFVVVGGGGVVDAPAPDPDSACRRS